MRLKIYTKHTSRWVFTTNHVIYDGLITTLEYANSIIEGYCRTHVDQRGETLYWEITSDGRRLHNGVIRPAKR